MKLLQVALLCVSYATCLGGEPARKDIAADMSAKVFSRIRRDVRFPAKSSVQGAAEAGAQPAFIRTEDVKDIRSPHGSLEPHIRVKRYRQNANHYPHAQSMRVGCRFGTCTVNNLVHQIFQYTDKDKDSMAPSSKIGSGGYGRRRRRSLPAQFPQLWGTAAAGAKESTPGPAGWPQEGEAGLSGCCLEAETEAEGSASNQRI